MRISTVEYEYKMDSMPFVADEMSIINGEIMKSYIHTFCIIGACFSGAHFISETFDSYDDAAKAFAKYCATVEYFDGGTCTLYECSLDDCEVIDNVWIA